MKTPIEPRNVATPNDPKLSDRGGTALHVPAEGKAAGSVAHAVTCRSGSLQRMVRRCGDSESVIFEEVIRDGVWCQRHPVTGEVTVSPPLSELRQVIDESGKWVRATEEHRAMIARGREERLAAGLVPVLAAESHSHQ